MRILSFSIPFLILVIAGTRQDSPHGSAFKINCNVCHSPKGLELDREIYSFDHNTTQLPLEGQHSSINCKGCHPTLVFADAETDCFSCHTDMHNQTVGMDCARCHTPRSWIVENITDVHRQSRFPLQGPHFAAQCMDCHPSASLLSFYPVGVEGVDCHMQDYQSTTNPNHVSGNFSTQCFDCHLITAFAWEGSGYNHSFFPLTEGHAIYDCNRCHTGTDYSKFKIHDAQYFPIYTGSHRGEWDNCTECHNNPANYSIYSCIDCHEHSRSRMDSKHSEERDYQYVSSACLDCHPTGRGGD